MPFFTLGFLAGALVTKAVRKLLKPHFAEEETKVHGNSEISAGPSKSSLETKHPECLINTKDKQDSPSDKEGLNPNKQDTANNSEDTTTDPFVSPEIQLCKFSNLFNNCWMNATLQGVLGLNIVNRKLCRSPTEVSKLFPAAPQFGDLFLRALHNPGRWFSPTEIFPVLQELSALIPLLRMGEANDIVDFLLHLMHWLNERGVMSRLRVNKVTRCNQCRSTESNITSLGSVYFLPAPGNNDTTASLFADAVSDDHNKDQCNICGSELMKENFFISHDLITLYLPRTAYPTVFTVHVTPSENINIRVNGGEKTYRLASVICHKNLSSYVGHFYTYVLKEEKIVKADDERISAEDRKADIYKNGIIYFYEKCT